MLHLTFFPGEKFRVSLLTTVLVVGDQWNRKKLYNLSNRMKPSRQTSRAFETTYNTSRYARATHCRVWAGPARWHDAAVASLDRRPVDLLRPRSDSGRPSPRTGGWLSDVSKTWCRRRRRSCWPPRMPRATAKMMRRNSCFVRGQKHDTYYYTVITVIAFIIIIIFVVMIV